MSWHASANKARVIERKGGILIEIPPARIMSIAIFAAFCIVVDLIMIGLLISDGGVGGPNGRVATFVIGFFLCFMLWWAAKAFVVTMWRRETVAVDDARITVERRLLGFTFRKELVIVPEARLSLDEAYQSLPTVVGEHGIRVGLLPTSLDRGPIIYYGSGGWPTSFGDGLSKAEAADLVARIHAKSPSLVY